MKAGDTVKKELHELSGALSLVHKSLIEFQKRIQEDLDEKRLSAHDLLQSCIHHPDYEWLRKISTMMALIDEKSDEEQEVAEVFQTEIMGELQGLFIDETKHLNFKARIELALTKDPLLHLELVQLKKRIGKPL